MNGERQEGRQEKPPDSMPFSEREQSTAAVEEDQGLGEQRIEDWLRASPEGFSSVVHRFSSPATEIQPRRASRT
jgi:hypothetical protein